MLLMTATATKSHITRKDGPRRRRTSDETFFQKEKKEIFSSSWCFLGRADEIPDVGDFRTVESPVGPVIVVRDKSEKIRVFSNTCLHRGCRITKEENGKCRAFVCPYHGWSYNLDVRLISAKHMEGSDIFSPEDHKLRELNSDVWAGFVFMNLDPDAMSLGEWLGDMPEVFRYHDVQNLRCVGKDVYTVKANWKIIIENAIEDYHTERVHKGSIGAVLGTRIKTAGQWQAIFVESERRWALLKGQEAVLPEIATLDETGKTRSYFTVAYPNTQFVFSQDSAWWLNVTPLTVDTSRLEVGYCFPKESTERADFEKASQPYLDRWRMTTDEDRAIVEEQQQGMRAPLHKTGPLSPTEDMVNRFDQWVLGRVVPD